MTMSNAMENAFALLFFNATAWADIAENDTSSPLANYYVALYTSDPGEAGTAITNEAAYTDYARVAVARTSGGFTVTNNVAANTAAVTFPACGATGATITHAGLVSTASGAGMLYISDPLGASLIVNPGITPSFAIGVLTFTFA